MAGFDVKCPKCDKQSAEYDENRWECLHCGNKFVDQTRLSIHQTQAPDDETDFGIDSTTGDGGSASDAPIILTTNSEGPELLPDIELGGKRDAEVILGFEEDEDFKGPTPPPAFDDLLSEEDPYSDSIPDPDYPEPGEDGPPLSIRGRWIPTT